MCLSVYVEMKGQSKHLPSPGTGRNVHNTAHGEEHSWVCNVLSLWEHIALRRRYGRETHHFALQDLLLENRHTEKRKTSGENEALLLNGPAMTNISKVHVHVCAGGSKRKGEGW